MTDRAAELHRGSEERASEPPRQAFEIERLEKTALAILENHKTMAISTLRSDGWPQTTIVGYANEGFTLYFVVFRSSQKFVNIKRDDRVSVAIGSEPPDIHLATAFYAAAFASEVETDEAREHAWRTLTRRHLNLVGRPMPDLASAAILRADCRHVSIVDNSQGLGHVDTLTITNGAAES